MFFTRIYRPHMTLRLFGVLLLLCGGVLLWQGYFTRGWSWSLLASIAMMALGLLFADWVRKITFDEKNRVVLTETGFWPMQAKHRHEAHQIRSIRLSVRDRGASSPDRPLKLRTTYRAQLVWNAGRKHLLMSGPSIKWIDARAYSLSSLMGIAVETTDGYKRYHKRAFGHE